MQEKFLQITSKQLTNKQRKAKANFMVYTQFAKENTVKQVEEILKKINIYDKSTTRNKAKI